MNKPFGPESSAERRINPEHELTIEEKRVEVINEIRDEYGILFITLVPPDVARSFGVSGDNEWFRKALGVSADSKQLKTLDAVNEALPDTVEETGIIIGGSPYSVYEKENEPWMIRLKEFLRAMHAQGKPTLGVCFGQQLIASTFGGKVEKNPRGRNFGSLNVDLTEEGTRDPLFEGVPRHFTSQQSHQDIVTELPQLEEVAVLARNDMDALHALTYGKSTRSVQFHPEITPETMENIAHARKVMLTKQGFFKDDEDFKRFLGTLKDTPQARQVLHNFLVKFVLRK